jgi:hypothetical protein
LGSKAGGGMATYQRTNAGLKVAPIEAGAIMGTLPVITRESNFALYGNHPGAALAPKKELLRSAISVSAAKI